MMIKIIKNINKNDNNNKTALIQQTYYLRSKIVPLQGNHQRISTEQPPQPEMQLEDRLVFLRPVPLQLSGSQGQSRESLCSLVRSSLAHLRRNVYENKL